VAGEAGAHGRLGFMVYGLGFGDLAMAKKADAVVDEDRHEAKVDG
jgi:hypothetical protein